MFFHLFSLIFFKFKFPNFFLLCRQCLFLCCSRCPEAGIRLGTSSVGLLPLAASATGQGIRSRILALQLLTTACDKTALGHGSQKSVQCGHTSVSEALSTLRLRCGEPVRFRLLVGMLNSGGGTGELQVHGLRFINTFLESAENIQNRLYLQAELFQAGFEPTSLVKVYAWVGVGATIQYYWPYISRYMRHLIIRSPFLYIKSIYRIYLRRRHGLIN